MYFHICFFFLLELANFYPTRNCTENEIECKNSYGYEICVEERFKYVACADYSTFMCDEKSLNVVLLETDESFYKYRNIEEYVKII